MSGKIQVSEIIKKFMDLIISGRKVRVTNSNDKYYFPRTTKGNLWFYTSDDKGKWYFSRVGGTEIVYLDDIDSETDEDFIAFIKSL